MCSARFYSIVLSDLPYSPWVCLWTYYNCAAYFLISLLSLNVYAASGVPKAFELFLYYFPQATFAHLYTLFLLWHVAGVSRCGYEQYGQCKFATGTYICVVIYRTRAQRCMPPTNLQDSTSCSATCVTSMVSWLLLVATWLHCARSDSCVVWLLSLRNKSLPTITNDY